MRISHAATALAALAMTGASGDAASPQLEGLWSAPGVILTIGPDAMSLRQDCAEARFGPVATDPNGAFKADGEWEDYAPGPQAADEPAKGSRASVEGRLRGDTLQLTVKRSGHPAQSFTLLRGKRAKLVRCL